MHPPVRCIEHSTVLMSDISCVWKRDTKRDISTWSLTGGGMSRFFLEFFELTRSPIENLGFHFRSLFRRVLGRFSYEIFRTGSLLLPPHSKRQLSSQIENNVAMVTAPFLLSRRDLLYAKHLDP